jgi:BASS family bile acid:Na+ symporter
MKLKHSAAYTIAVEMGLQNSVLALFIANQLLKDQDISLVAILYGSFSLIITFLGGWILKHYFGKENIEKI